jgi:hypothetical protein
MKRYVAALAPLLLILAAACGAADTAPKIPTMTGRWTGTVVEPGTTTALEMSLTESGAAVSGSGVATVGFGAGVDFAVAGTHVDPSVTLTLSLSSVPMTWVFTGRFQARDSVSGTFDFDTTRLVILRRE